MDRPSFHPVAWVLWGATALGTLLVTQNPLYLTLILLALLWVRSALDAAPMTLPPRLLLLMPLLAALANGLTIHAGETVVATLPRGWPLIGGPLTLEAIALGASSGYGLAVLIVLFATLGAGVSRAAALRLVPGFLFQAGLVTTIALAFVPQTRRAFSDIREAQQIRGKRFEGWRDLPPLFLPLLTLGLERAISLAEAMESRGFGAAASQRHGSSLRLRLLLLGALLVVVIGVGLILLSAQRMVGLASLLAGIAVAALALWRMGRRVRHTTYRPQPWHRHDRLLVFGSVALLIAIVLVALRNPTALRFYPFPRLTLPPFDALLGTLMALVALPALLINDKTIER